MDHAGEYITPQIIRAEPVLGGGWLQDISGLRGYQLIGGDKIGKYSDKDEQQ